MQRFSLRIVAALAALAAAAALGVAFASEFWGELIPCALCLLERWPYRLLIVIGSLATIAPRRLVRPLLVLAVLCAFSDAAIAFTHLGVEQAWWPSPLPECAAAHITGASIAQRLASMPARPSKPCDEPTFLVPGVPVSMALMNLLFAIGLGGFIAAFVVTPPARR